MCEDHEDCWTIFFPLSKSLSVILFFFAYQCHIGSKSRSELLLNPSCGQDLVMIMAMMISVLHDVDVKRGRHQQVQEHKSISLSLVSLQFISNQQDPVKALISYQPNPAVVTIQIISTGFEASDISLKIDLISDHWFMRDIRYFLSIYLISYY